LKGSKVSAIQTSKNFNSAFSQRLCFLLYLELQIGSLSLLHRKVKGLLD